MHGRVGKMVLALQQFEETEHGWCIGKLDAVFLRRLLNLLKDSLFEIKCGDGLWRLRLFAFHDLLEGLINETKGNEALAFVFAAGEGNYKNHDLSGFAVIACGVSCTQAEANDVAGYGAGFVKVERSLDCDSFRAFDFQRDRNLFRRGLHVCSRVEDVSKRELLQPQVIFHDGLDGDELARHFLYVAGRRFKPDGGRRIFEQPETHFQAFNIRKTNLVFDSDFERRLLFELEFI